MNMLLTIIVTFFCRYGGRAWNRFCGNERRGGHQSNADHISRDGSVYGGGNRIILGRSCKCGVGVYIRKNKNLDIRNGIIMMVSVLLFTVFGSYVSSLVPSAAMGNFSVFMTFLLGIKFIVRPVMTTKEAMQGVSAEKRAVQSVICGVLIGFICGFVGAGGGMMMLLILTSVLGYELKTAVGTSVFIMTFTALTGAASHFAIGGAPDWTVLILCVVFTLIWARIAAVFANKATPKTLNRATGVILVILGLVVMLF